METLDRLAEKLQCVDFDLDRLTDEKRAEVYALARAAGIELYRPGAVWPSSLDIGERGGGLTRL